MAKRRNKLKNKQKIANLKPSKPKIKLPKVEDIQEETIKVIKKISGMEITIIMMISLLIIIILGGISIFLSIASPKTSREKYNILEQDMKNLVTEYYETDLKGKNFTMNRQKISLKTLKDAGYDTKKIINPYTKVACREDSYSIIYIKEEDKVEVVNYLICDNYITNHK